MEYGSFPQMGRIIWSLINIINFKKKQYYYICIKALKMKKAKNSFMRKKKRKK